MLAVNFKEDYSQYENFMVWEIADMDAFFEGNGAIVEIFQDHYDMPVEDFHTRRKEISQTKMQVMETVLDQVGDKHFFIFTKMNPSQTVSMETTPENTSSFNGSVRCPPVINKTRHGFSLWNSH